MISFVSDMEKAVLRCLADGMHTKEIAVVIQRSSPTVEQYVKALCLKFQARSRAHLVAQAMRQGLI